MANHTEESEALARLCAEHMYANDHASQSMGIKIQSVSVGAASISMKVREDMLNGYKNCHGGFLFALADSASAFACNSYNQITVAQGCSIEYVRPAKLGEILTAEASEQSRGKKTGVYDVLISNEFGKTVALFRGKSFSLDGQVLP